MTKEMTGRERMLTALTGGTPDRVPVAPDLSIMIPCRLQKRPFWEMEVNENPPLWRAYIDAVRYYDIDGWMWNGILDVRTDPPVEHTSRVVRRTEEFWEVRGTYRTPKGDLTYTRVAPRDNPAVVSEGLVKDLETDLPKLRYLFPEIRDVDASTYHEQRRLMGDSGMICVFASVPGFPSWVDWFDGGLEALTYAFYDYPDLFEELADLHSQNTLRFVELAVGAGVESILTGGSGSITLQSPEIFETLGLPTLRPITRLCRQAGVVSGVHSCGKEWDLLRLCAAETELDYANPLEVRPMGDCDLAACKAAFGDRLSLMGNLHTTSVMLEGSVRDVRRESLKAILAAGQGGGFVLSTGDQCGRDTPDENIREMVRVGREFGSYPLDSDRISEEILSLERT